MGNDRHDVIWNFYTMYKHVDESLGREVKHLLIQKFYQNVILNDIKNNFSLSRHTL